VHLDRDELAEVDVHPLVRADMDVTMLLAELFMAKSGVAGPLCESPNLPRLRALQALYNQHLVPRAHNLRQHRTALCSCSPYALHLCCQAIAFLVMCIPHTSVAAQHHGHTAFGEPNQAALTTSLLCTRQQPSASAATEPRQAGGAAPLAGTRHARSPAATSVPGMLRTVRRLAASIANEASCDAA